MLGRSFKGNAISAAPLHPFRAPSPLILRGKLIGLDSVGRSVLLDPWQMQKERIIASMIILLLGNKNAGKSTLAKSIAALLMTMQAQLGAEMRIRINDRKPENGQPEWAPLAHVLGCKVIALNQLRLNVFDPIMVKDFLSLLSIAKKILELIMQQSEKRSLNIYENLALQIAVDKLWSGRTRNIASPEILAEILRKLTRADYDTYFEKQTGRIYENFRKELDADTELKRELDLIVRQEEVTTDFEEFFKAAGKLNAALVQVMGGVYGEVFSGNQSMYDFFRMPALLLDWTGIEGFQQVLLQTVFYSFETAAMVAGMNEIIPHVLVSEEEHEGMLVLSWLEAKAARNAKARALPTVDISTTQFTNGLKIGNKDDYIREVADRIYRGTDLMIAGGLPYDEGTIHDLTEWGFSEMMARDITNYTYGTFGVKVRNPAITAFKMQHILTPSVRKIAVTNSATEQMLIGRMPTLDNPDVLRRLAVANIDPLSLTRGVPL